MARRPELMEGSTEALTLALVAFNADGRLGMPAFSLLTLVMLGFFLTPALLERRIRHVD